MVLRKRQPSGGLPRLGAQGGTGVEKRNLTYFMICFGILILVVVMVFARGFQRRTSHIELPDSAADSTEDEGSGDEGETKLPLVEVTPETVQDVIATMERLSTYGRTITVETFWAEGSASSTTAAYVRDELTRLDTTLPDGSIRHLLTDGQETCIWYDDARSWASYPSGKISGDQEQRILTYEDLLTLEPRQITSAAYASHEGIPCIQVEASEEGGERRDLFWISTETGLLIAAETWEGETLTYRMTSLTIDVSLPEDTYFLLPDGSAFA